MSNYQRIELIGRTGKEIEKKVFESGDSVSSVSIAVSESYKNKQGEKVESVEWFPLEFWGKLAEIASNFIKKGDLIFVSGKIKTETWEKDGVKHSRIKVRVNELTMLGSKSDSGQSNQSQPAYKPLVNEAKDDFFDPEKDDLPF